MTVVSPADRPKLVRNSCIIERICSVFVSCHFTYALSVVKGVCHTAASDLFPFLFEAQPFINWNMFVIYTLSSVFLLVQASFMAYRNGLTPARLSFRPMTVLFQISLSFPFSFVLFLDIEYLLCSGLSRENERDLTQSYAKALKQREHYK